MERVTFRLCPACDACPEVLITDAGVSIGEGGQYCPAQSC